MRARRPRSISVHADRFELVLTDHREGDVAVRDHRHLRTVGSVNGEAGGAVDRHGLHIGDMLHAQHGQVVRRHLSHLFDCLHHPYLPLGRSSAGRQWVKSPSDTLPGTCQFRANDLPDYLDERTSVGWVRVSSTGSALPRPSLISIVRTRASIGGRIKSICRSPLSSQAPRTSMPSASTNERWNWRAAMPRWR